uniref:Multidrug and toxin extrusion protein n=1 Tax=Loxodonta africana TaxID=9785 RepID=G3UD35_LOXAF
MDSLQETGPPAHGCCRPALRRLFPVGFGAEARKLFVLSGPLFLFQMLTFLIYVVSTVFCGHLGKVELASVTLAVAFVNVCGVSVGFGLASACDTLMSQSFGSQNKKHVGVILQRGTLILLLSCFPCWALYLNTEQLLLLLRQDPAVSRLTQDYVMIFIPALPAIFLYCLLAKYLQNQGIIWPEVLSGIVGNCVNGLANYALVSVLNLGVRGSAYANTISQYMQTIFLFFYIVLKKLHLETWAGWSSQCLQDWGSFFSLAIPSMLMMCIEWWAYEIGSFLMDIKGCLKSNSSITSLSVEVCVLLSVPPMGNFIVLSVKVYSSIRGGGRVQLANKSRKCVLFAKKYSMSTFKKKIILGSHFPVLHSFTYSWKIRFLAKSLSNLPVHCLSYIVYDAVNCVYGGILRGTGKQAFGAIVNLIMYYVIALPLGAVLTFVVRMRIMGLWLGMFACALLAAAAFVAYTAQINWKLAAEEAQKHAGLQRNVAASSALVQSFPIKPLCGSSVWKLFIHRINMQGQIQIDSSSDQVVRMPETALGLSVSANMLSVKQLAVRRGAALGAASATLILGLVVRVLTTSH